jgi:hypothetical protein
MKAVRVQYEVKPDYVESNQKNIDAVMKALKENPIEGMYYSAYLIEGTNQFMHINVATDGETMNKLNSVEEFQYFRKNLKASEPVKPPKAESLNFIGSGFDL